jgi:hypothetical protein
MLAKLDFDGRSWFRLAPAAADTTPSIYLEVRDQDQVTANLELIPFAALETLNQIANLRLHPAGSPQLLSTPNLVRMGRVDGERLAGTVAQWLFHNSPAFREVKEVLLSRRGKTVLHQNVLIARVTDLSLKVALEKSLEDSWLALPNDYVAFPVGRLSDVQRVVKKSGHVIKEVAANER